MEWFRCSELDHHKFGTFFFFAADDTDVTDEGEEEADRVAWGQSGEQETVPLAITLENCASRGRLLSEPFIDVGEHELIIGIESNGAEGHHSSEDDSKVFRAVLLVTEAGHGNEKATFGEGSGCHRHANGLHKSERIGPNHWQLADTSNHKSNDDNEAGTNLASEESKNTA